LFGGSSLVSTSFLKDLAYRANSSSLTAPGLKKAASG
jgi:hypothetical protein